MAGPFELKTLWRKYREYRVNKKRRLSQESFESQDSKGCMVLEEGTIIIVGLGMDTKQEEECIEYVSDDDDPRFIDNPHGIGCSRTYEVPYDDVMNSLSTSPASMPSPPPREINLDEIDGLRALAKLGPWKSENIDMVKGKRKGREPGDSANDRCTSLLDGATSPAKSSGRIFTLLRQRARTR